MTEAGRPPDERIDVLATELDEMVCAFEAHPDEVVRRAVFALLDRVDRLHRTALTRLVARLHEAGARTALARALRDPAVHMLLDLYDLLPDAGPALPEWPLPGAAAVPPGPATAMPSHFIPLSAITVPPTMEWQPAAPLAGVPPGTVRSVTVAGRPLVLCNVEGEVFALRDSCSGSMLPLAAGEIAGSDLRCPWHGCRYDVRTGRSHDAARADLETFPVTVEDGVVRVRLPVQRSLSVEGSR